MNVKVATISSFLLVLVVGCGGTPTQPTQPEMTDFQARVMFDLELKVNRTERDKYGQLMERLREMGESINDSDTDSTERYGRALLAADKECLARFKTSGITVAVDWFDIESRKPVEEFLEKWGAEKWPERRTSTAEKFLNRLSTCPGCT